MKQLMPPPAQQEGAGKNPALFAVDALPSGRAENAQLCRPETTALCPEGTVSRGGTRADLLGVANSETASLDSRACFSIGMLLNEESCN